jgi:peptidoglycan hydrolase CwlO-like protein
MGYASYLEDIISKVSAIEGLVEEQKRPTDKSELGKYGGLKKKDERLEDVTNRLRKEITDLQTLLQKIKKESAERGFLLRKEQGKSNSLSIKIDQESDLRKLQEKTERDLSDLVIDFQRLFQSMNDIAKSNAWYKDKSKVKQIESLIESGLRRN